MTNEQEVKLCYCENLGIIEKSVGTEVHENTMKIKMIGAIFVRKEDMMVSKCMSFTDTFSLPVKAIENKYAVLKKRISDLRIRIKLININLTIQPP